MLAEVPGITVRDFFDKEYIERHDFLLEQRRGRYSPFDIREYSLVAKELSWIDREDNGYFIIVPKTVGDLKYEGDMQHHCVYTNGYCQLVARRESIIVFLRKEETVPCVTIEYDYETFDVLQAYGKFNTRINNELYQYIVDLGKQLYAERCSQQ